VQRGTLAQLSLTADRVRMERKRLFLGLQRAVPATRRRWVKTNMSKEIYIKQKKQTKPTATSTLRLTALMRYTRRDKRDPFRQEQHNIDLLPIHTIHINKYEYMYISKYIYVYICIRIYMHILTCLCDYSLCTHK